MVEERRITHRGITFRGNDYIAPVNSGLHWDLVHREVLTPLFKGDREALEKAMEIDKMKFYYVYDDGTKSDAYG